ncbi:MAG: peptide chain release factor 1 [Deltaproteobacteria bacterium]|nr:MAG: peptide chain release factor 1 [Deltaproteobacteria bacterium]
MFQRLDQVEARLAELDQALMDPATLSNRRRMRELTRERSRIVPVVERWRELQKLEEELAGARELLADPEYRDIARAEIAELEERIPALKQELKLALLPPDPFEGRDVILEIRAGTGGDEACLFAADLLRMYTRYAESQGWKVELISASEITVGGVGGRTAVGYREVITQISGDDAYTHLQWESGVHRVQRVPLTETQGRIHTSAATVAILPVADEVEVDIADSDLRIDVYRASGPGGQSVNTTDSAVRITHLPTGLVVTCQDEKSQHKNKAKALKVLAARLLEKMQAEQDAVEAEERRSQIGSGDRSERIRTYNFPQNRLTDHRIGLTLYQLDRIVEGDLDPVISALNAEFQARMLARMDDAGA